MGENVTDAEIVETLATKIMGWKVRALALTSGVFDEPNDGMTHVWPRDFDPLTSVSDAFAALEAIKMNPRDFAEITTCMVDVDSRYWSVDLFFNEKHYMAEGSKLPRVICDALATAIAAIGEKKP